MGHPRPRRKPVHASFEQFQFSRVSVSIVNADGTETNIDADAGRFRNPNKYGSGSPARERYGHWEADDYGGTHSDEKVTMPGETDLNGHPLKSRGSKAIRIVNLSIRRRCCLT